MIKIWVIKQEYTILVVMKNIDFAWLPAWKHDFSWLSYYSLSENACVHALTRIIH